MTDGENRLRERSHGLLWFGERGTGSTWNITDPVSAKLRDACERLRPESVYVGGEYVGDKLTPEEKQQRDDMYVVLRCVEDYVFLTTYALGVEHCIKKLRTIWRALRQSEKEKHR